MGEIVFDSCSWYSVVFNREVLLITTKYKLEQFERIELPKKLISFILLCKLPSPLPIRIVSYNEDVSWIVYNIGYNPLTTKGYMEVKDIIYDLKWL